MQSLTDHDAMSACPTVRNLVDPPTTATIVPLQPLPLHSQSDWEMRSSMLQTDRSGETGRSDVSEDWYELAVVLWTERSGMSVYGFF